jgi:branched-chain amino acid transport system substrate-binding protein
MKTPTISPLVFDMVLRMPEPRPKTVAIFEINQLDCQETVEYWRKDAEKGGFKIVYHQKYPLGTKDFSAMITGAKAAGAEIHLAYPTPGEGIAIIKQMKELDYNPKLIYWARAAASAAFGNALGPLADYITLPIDWCNQLGIPGNDELNAEHQKRYGRLGDPFAGSSYVAAQVLGAAIQKAGTLDRKAIRDAIAATDMETVVGRVRFSPQGWVIDLLNLVLQWQGGKQNVVHYNKTGEKYKQYIPKVDMKWQPAWSAR